MTRENKLALIVGFGLVLLVGIVISDHFSAARLQEQADLTRGTVRDPLAADSRSQADPVSFRLIRGGGETDRPGFSRNGVMPVDSSDDDLGPARRAEPAPGTPDDPLIDDTITIGSASPDRRRSPANPPAPRVHHVRKGESLTAIARRYSRPGAELTAAELAAHNDIDDPDRLPVGRRLEIPVVGAIPASGRTAPAPVPVNEPRTYTARKGDTLSEISARFLGSAGRWRDILGANPDVLDDPKDLRPGMELVIPAR